MKHVWKRILTVMLAAALLLSVWPVELTSGTAYAAASYGRTTADKVCLRKTASTGADYWFRLDLGYVCKVLDTKKSGGVTWYKVDVAHPTNSHTYIGYIHGDYFELMTPEEAAEWEENPDQANADASESGDPDGTEGGAGEEETDPEPEVPTPTPAPDDGSNESAAPGATGKVTLDKVNFRQSEGGKVIDQLNRDTVVEILSVPSVVDSNHWYKVRYNGKVGYIQAPYIKVVSNGSVATPVPDNDNVVCYVKTTEQNVNLRLKPAGETIEQVKRGTILPVVAVPVKPEGSKYTWYYVKKGNIHGYLRGDCVITCDKDGNRVDAPTPAPGGGGSTPPSGETYGYVKTTQAGVNLRTKPAGSSQEQIAKGVILPIIGKIVSSGRYDWYPVRAASGRTGYLRSDCVTVTTSGGDKPSEPSNPDTGKPPVSAYGYIMVTEEKVNLRKTMAGDRIGVLEKNTVWPMNGNRSEKKVGGYYWYPVDVNGKSGFVRDDCAFKLSPEQEESYLAGNGVPGGSKPSVPETTVSYVQTILDDVNLRASASKDANAPFNVKKGTVMAYNSTTTVGGAKWYHVIYSNQELWVLESCVKVMSQKEYDDYLASKPESTPQPDIVVGYIKTTENGVNLRATPGGSNILGRVDKGIVLPYSREPVADKSNNLWYYVKTGFGYGYLRGDCVEECDAKGEPKPITPTNPPSESGQEASYKTLRRGSTGTDVKNMVTELKIQGFYTGAITSSFTSAVETAVKNFQKAKGLTVDGIAGPKTLHKLFGTVPIGEGDASNLTMTLYPAEKIDWFTGGIQTLWAKGANYKVYDVKTGIVWWAHRWSGGYHADVEPLTAADSARFCRMYGVSKPEDIEKNNLWQRRPSLVTIGNRTFACSLYGVPHNYPDGDTISTNNFKGQVCLHFTNSKTHVGNQVDTYHKEAIEYAWQHAPNGHK